MEEINNQLNKVSISIEIKVFSLVAIFINIIGTIFVFYFQHIDSGCGINCMSFSFLMLIIIYYISVASSLFFLKNNPLIIGLWLIATSFVGILFSFIFAIPSFVILLYCGAKILENNWNSNGSMDNYNQLIIGLFLMVISFLIAGFRLLQLI